MAAGHFDENDLKSFYFKGLKHDDASAILKDEPEGTFLIRDSARGGGFAYVVCIKEGSSVMQYSITKNDAGKIFIRPEFLFNDLPGLLSFYKRNTFTTSALIKPVSKERVRYHDLQCQGAETLGDRPMTMIETPTQNPTARRQNRSSEPCPPVYARVVKSRTPISYDQSGLSLKIGEIIRVTRRSNGQGYGEILKSSCGEEGKTGHFPLTHVELVESVESLELSKEA